MQLVIDANILIAAFLKSSVTRELLFDDDIELFAPEYFALEVKNTFKKNKSLRRRAGVNEKQLEELLELLLSQIKIIPEEEYESFMPKAVQNVPYDDAPYLALSVALGIPIWSNDAAFKEQRLASIYTTPELIKIINKE